MRVLGTQDWWYLSPHASLEEKEVRSQDGAQGFLALIFLRLFLTSFLLFSSKFKMRTSNEIGQLPYRIHIYFIFTDRVNELWFPKSKKQQVGVIFG